MEPSRTERGRHFRADKVVDPQPGQRPKPDLQSARPVRSAMKRVIRDPTVDLRANLIQVPNFARQPVGLGQNNQVLMTVQFPNQLVVAGAGSVKVRNAAKITQIGFDAARVIAPPMDVGPGVDSHREDWKLVALDLIREIDQLLRVFVPGNACGKRQLRTEAGLEGGSGW